MAPPMGLGLGLDISLASLRGFFPRSLPNCTLWLDAARGVTVTGTGNASAWNDLSGLGNHVTQSSTSLQPLFVPGNYWMNQRPALRFSAAAGSGLHNLTATLVPQSGARTVFAAVRSAPGATGGGSVVAFVRTIPDWAFQDLFLGSYVFGTGGTNINLSGTPTSPSPLNITRWVTWRTTGTGNVLRWRNLGVEWTNLNGGTVPAETTPTGFAIGTRPYGGTGIQSFDGDIAEIIVYARALSDAEILQVEAYLQAKYSTAPFVYTPAGSPITRQPLQWLDPAVGVTTLSGNVSKWNDQSGNGYHQAQATSAKRPLLITTAATHQKGQPLVQFDGADDFVAASYYAPEPKTVVIFAKYTTAAPGALFDGGIATVNRGRFYRPAAGTFDLGNGGQTPIASTTLEAWHARIVIFNGASGSSYREDSDAPVSFTPGSYTTSDGMTLAALAAGQYWGAVQIGAVFVFPFVLTASEITAMIAYGAAKYSTGLLGMTAPALWVDAALGVTLNGSNVSAWADQSGNGRHLVQATAGYQPLFVASAINSLPAVRFDGADDILLAAGFTTASSGAIFVVFKFVTAPSSDATHDIVLSGQYSEYFLQITPTLARFNCGGATDYTPGIGTAGVYRLVAMTITYGTTGTMRVNGTQVATATVSAGTMAGFSLGALWNNTRNTNIEVAEVLVYPGVLSSANIATVETYLQTKYGL